MIYRKNVAYFFIPFKIKQKDHFDKTIKHINKNVLWKLQEDKFKYFFKYISDKLDSDNEAQCQCYHYKLDNSARGRFGIPNCEELWNAWNENCEFVSKFKLLDVHLYCFTTSVCIMAFQVSFEKGDPYEISGFEYEMKKIGKTMVEYGELKTTLLDLAKTITADIDKKFPLEFFYFANPGTERSNVLTLIEDNVADVKPEDRLENRNKKLYFLENCYSQSFIYDKELHNAHVHSLSQDVFWGVSSEAAACLVYPKSENDEFIKETFFENFNTQYLCMYILLLHQKYTLYMFLTNIGVGKYKELEELETYQNELYEFETDFVFSQISEVPQYQTLYEKMARNFALKKMYKDIHDPVVSLSEMRSKDDDKREKQINSSLIVISILAFFSAFSDAFASADGFAKLSQFFGFAEKTAEILSLAFQIGSVLLISAMLVYIICVIIKNRKKK